MQRLAIRTLIFGMLSCFGTSFSLAEDATLEKGYLSRQRPKAGILVHLHGCEGLVVIGRLKGWMSYFEKLGYKVIAPNSFADERPPASCKPPFPPDKSTVYSVRIAQTNRVLEQVRQQYPGFGYMCGVTRKVPALPILSMRK
jgi:dienelactone hydrolase